MDGDKPVLTHQTICFTSPNAIGKHASFFPSLGKLNIYLHLNVSNQKFSNVM